MQRSCCCCCCCWRYIKDARVFVWNITACRVFCIVESLFITCISADCAISKHVGCCIWIALTSVDVMRAPVSVIFKIWELTTMNEKETLLWFFMPSHYSGLLWTEPHEDTEYCPCVLYVFFLYVIRRCIYCTNWNDYSLLQRSSLSRTRRLLRSLTRAMTLSSCVTSSALRHPQLSGNIRGPRFNQKKTVRGAFSLPFSQSLPCFLLLFSNREHIPFSKAVMFSPQNQWTYSEQSSRCAFCAVFSWIDLF